MKYNEVLDRLQNLIKYRPSQAELMKILSVKQSTISNRANRNSDIQSEDIEKINQYYKINLFTNTLQNNITNEFQKEVNNSYDDCLSLPVRGNLAAASGYGFKIGNNEQETCKYYISRNFLKTVGANPEHTDFIPCEGDSMAPTIEGGSLLMVDKSKTEIYDGKIYCIRLNGQLLAKRLQFLPPNTVRVVSDNYQKYKPFEVDLSQELTFDFAIIGQVKWHGTVEK